MKLTSTGSGIVKVTVTKPQGHEYPLSLWTIGAWLRFDDEACWVVRLERDTAHSTPHNARLRIE